MISETIHNLNCAEVPTRSSSYLINIYNFKTSNLKKTVLKLEQLTSFSEIGIKRKRRIGIKLGRTTGVSVKTRRHLTNTEIERY